MANKSKNHNHVVSAHHSQKTRIEFRNVGEAVARLVRFGATLSDNGNVYIEKRVGLKVLGAVDYISNCETKTRAIFGKAPAKVAA